VHQVGNQYLEVSVVYCAYYGEFHLDVVQLVFVVFKFVV